jgi:3-isopropylmalate dehydratase small subunit
LRDPAAAVTVDLACAEITLPGGERARFPIDPFAQKMLLAGTDELGYLLALSPHIDAFEKTNG